MKKEENNGQVSNETLDPQETLIRDIDEAIRKALQVGLDLIAISGTLSVSNNSLFRYFEKVAVAAEAQLKEKVVVEKRGEEK